MARHVGCRPLWPATTPQRPYLLDETLVLVHSALTQFPPLPVPSSTMASSGSSSDTESDPIDWDGLVKEEGSGSEAPDDEELALCIAIERSRVDIGRSSSSAPFAPSPVDRRDNAPQRGGPPD